MRLERVWAASGAISVALFACGLVFGDLLAADNYPALDASAAELRRYFLDNTAEARALGFFHVLSGLALLCFAAYLGAVISRLDRGLGALAAVGGAVAAAFLLASALLYRTLTEPAVARDPALTHALLVLSYLVGGPAISVPLALPIGAGAALALRRALLPRWSGWLGAAAAVVSIASAITLLGPANNTSVVYGVLLLAALLGFVWIVAASLALACTGTRDRAHRPPAAPSARAPAG
jgi:hypothetical protein